ncbi:MAG: substrate-binding domain-containing protein [Thermoplasmata archaeon]
MTADDAAPSGAASDSFESQASTAGLVLPRRTGLNLWLAVAIVAIVVGASVGVGDLTGWAIGPHAARGGPGLYGPQQCAHVPSYLSVYLPASISPHADPELSGAFTGWGTGFSNWSGGCVHLEESMSSGDGYTPDLAGGLVDLVATDAAPNATDRAGLPHAIDLVPAAVVPVAVLYDLPGISAPLRLDGAVLAGIFNGSITSWNDPAIASLNPSVDLSGMPAVTALYRSDASGVNGAFTHYLASASRSWNASVGWGDSVAWPTGTAASGPAEMSTALARTPGAVGYVEATGSVPMNSSEALLENPAGSFSEPTSAGASAALEALQNTTPVQHADWTNVSLVDSPGAASYPVCELLLAAIYHDLGIAYGGHLSQTNATWLLTFLWWLGGDAGPLVSSLGFGLLPKSVVGLDQVELESVTYNGGSLLENNEGGGGETGEF